MGTTPRLLLNAYPALVELAWLSEQVEVVSQAYAERFGVRRDDAWFLLKLQEELGELTQAFLMRSGQSRPKGKSPAEIDEIFRAELADVLCHVLLLATHHGVDVEAAVTSKWLAFSLNPTVRGAGPGGSRAAGQGQQTAAEIAQLPEGEG